MIDTFFLLNDNINLVTFISGDRGEREAPSTMKKNKLIYSASVPISVPTWCPGIRDTGDIEEFDEDGVSIISIVT